MQQTVFPTLYTLDTKGAIRYWIIKAIKDIDSVYIERDYGQIGTNKPQRSRKPIKEIKSQKTLYNQAIFEAESEWIKQKVNKGYVENIDTLTSTTAQLMSASTFTTPKPTVQLKRTIPLKVPAKKMPLALKKLDKTILIPLKLAPKPISIPPGQNQPNYASFKFLPMLANKFTERGHNIQWPSKAQRKLDGVRCTTKRIPLSTGYEVILSSRNDKVYPYFDEIKDALNTLNVPPNMFLDGELYSLIIPFRTLNGYCNRRKIGGKSGYDLIPKNHLASIHYYIFDCYFPEEPNMPFSKRFQRLEELLRDNHSPYLKLVHVDPLPTEHALKPLHDKYVSEGYEGLMVRNISGIYKLKNRSSDLQKYKEFMDEEFIIVGATQGTGKEEGCLIWILRLKFKHVSCFDDKPYDKSLFYKDNWKTSECEANRIKDDYKFTCRPRASYEARHQEWLEYNAIPNEYIGKLYTVRFQEKYENGKPRFPAGISIRWDLPQEGEGTLII